MYIDLSDAFGKGEQIILDLSWFNIKWTYFFKSALFLILPFLGIFIKKSIGFIFLLQYFYFLLSNSFVQNYIIFQSESLNLLLLGFLSFIVSLILIINHRKVRNDYYNTKKEKLIANNMYSFLIGLLLSFLLLIGNF